MTALGAEQTAVVAFDCAAFPLLLLTLAAVLRLHRGQSTASHLLVRHRPLPFLLLLHGLILTQLLPSLLSLLIPASSFPCLALLIFVFLSSHLLLFLLVVHYSVHYARTAVNTAVHRSLLAAFHPPPPPLQQPWTALAEDKEGSFSIAITVINTAAQWGPSRSPSSSPTSASSDPSSRLSLSSSSAAGAELLAPLAAPASAHRQRYLSFLPFALLLLVGLILTVCLIAALSGSSPAADCPACQHLVIVQSCLLLLPALALLRLWLLLRPLPADYYGVKRELSLLLSLPLPLYALSLGLTAVSLPSAVLLLHISLLLLSLTTTGLPLAVSFLTPALPAVTASPSSSSSVSLSLFHARLRRPSAALLSFLRSALKLPELSLLRSLRAFHSQFAPSAAFHLSLRNPNLERIKHKKHRPKAHSTASQLHASAAAAASSHCPDAPALHLQTLLQSASALFALHFLPNSWQPVSLPSALHLALASQLQSISAEATDCSAADSPAETEQQQQPGRPESAALDASARKTQCSCCATWVSCSAAWRRRWRRSWPQSGCSAGCSLLPARQRRGSASWSCSRRPAARRRRRRRRRRHAPRLSRSPASPRRASWQSASSGRCCRPLTARLLPSCCVLRLWLRRLRLAAVLLICRLCI